MRASNFTRACMQASNPNPNQLLDVFAGNKTRGGLCPKCDRKACMDCGQKPHKVKSLCRREMPHHFNCCVPVCTNSFRSKPHLQYYRIPRTEKLRKTFQVLLRNETSKLHSNQTRVCSEHFEGGQKLSRQHLPSLFPWTKRAKQRRQIIKHEHDKNVSLSTHFC